MGGLKMVSEEIEEYRILKERLKCERDIERLRKKENE
jgi:hypothetical protein